MNYNSQDMNAEYLEEQFGNISIHNDGSYEYTELNASSLYVQPDCVPNADFYVDQATGLDPSLWECVSPETKSLNCIVEDLGPEEIRWFYKSDGDKRWLEFSGYDSHRIEFKYRQLFHEWQYMNEAYSDREGRTDVFVTPDDAAESALKSDDVPEDMSVPAYKVNVRGGMYEVDLHSWKCTSIYWPGEECVITRGSWFYDGTWQPLDTEQSASLETIHLHLFYGHKLSDYEQDPANKLPKTVLHTENYAEFHVDWVSPSEVYMYSEATPSKLVRSFTSKLGFHKPAGYRLYRGYKSLADESDRPVDITHLVFVIHGIGHKMDQGRIIKNTTLFRDCCEWLKQKYHAGTTNRAEFFPVEWRTALKLDGDIVEAITPQKILGFRTLLNSTAMDIMYYTSPVYGAEVQRGLTDELNQLYKMFTQRNPYFQLNGGKVSVIAHSLGCVILYDIVTGWKPGTQESPSPSSAAQVPPKSRLDFQIDNFFCLGSPLSVFLALRWRDPNDPALQDTILPTNLCNRFYNVFHPTDPVAYRVEPLMNRAYSRVSPLSLQPYNATGRSRYCDMPLELINPVSSSSTEQVEVDSPSDTPSKDRGWSLWGMMRGNWKNQDGASSPLLDAASAGVLGNRLDYVLRETSIGVSYLSALTSHTAYWNNYDVAYFVLTRLFPDLENESASGAQHSTACTPVPWASADHVVTSADAV